MRLIQGDYEQNISYCRDMMKEDFFEFDFPYVASSEKFREIDRFLWESKHQHTRFRNRYEGRAVIDISAWNRHFPNEYFDAFMYFIKGNEANISCTLISDGQCSKEVMDRLKKLFRISETELDTCRTTLRDTKKIGFVIEEENENV